MDINKPSTSFLFPYRWLTDDREYLGTNLVNLCKKNSLNQVYHSKLDKGISPAYVAILTVHAWQPVPIQLTKTQLEKYLKPVFPYTKCAQFDVMFQQKKDRESIPTLELSLYY